MGILAAKLAIHHISTAQFENIADAVRERLLSVCNPQMIYIFGSYGRGVVSSASDLDIAVIFEDSKDLIRQKKRVLNSKLFLDYSTDFLFFSAVDFENKAQIGGVCSLIKKEGKIIYDQRTKI